MSFDLLAKWLDWYDPIHRGWTLKGIANGVCATNGFSFPRIQGGYNLRRAVGELPGPTAAIVGAAGAQATTIRTFPWVSHSADTEYTYRLMAVGGGGVENVADEVTTVAPFDSGGDWVGLRPNAPTDLRVTAASGGKFVLRWTYTREGEQVEPAQFRIYNDAGSGDVDYETVVATVSYRRGRFHYLALSSAFSDGVRVRWGVRAVSASGVEEDNQIVVEQWADAQPPPINPTVLTTCAQDDS
jgi:hypothetical protein